MALINKLKAIADAIRAKTDGTEELTLDQMPGEIESISGGNELNFDGVFDQEQANEINQYYKDGIEYAREIAESWDENATNISSKFLRDEKLIFLPKLDLTKATTASFFCRYCYNLEYVPFLNLPNVGNMEYAFNNCYNLKELHISAPKCANFSDITYLISSMRKVYIECDSATNFNRAFYAQYGTKEITLTNVENVTKWSETFVSNSDLRILKMAKWKQGDIFLSSSGRLFVESIHYIIQNAVDVADGATARTLTLTATTKTNWQNSEYYEQDLAVLEQKGITIA